MKHVVSISLGSSARDKRVETEILGESVLIERIGTDGDQQLARRKYLELDGQVDCFGIGGCELGVPIGSRYYKIHAVQNLVEGLKSPAVDGLGIRSAVEGNIADWLDKQTGEKVGGSTVMFCVGSGRYHMLDSFRRQGCRLMICDAGFLLGIPLYTRHLAIGKFFVTLYGPLVSRLPFSVLYPTGEKQRVNRPRFRRWFEKADIIADDFHYIRRNMPEDLSGKIIVTNTTTEEDLEELKKRNVRLLCTTTPRLNGRSFGTNVMEAALTAIGGNGKTLPPDRLRMMLDEARIQPTLNLLNP
ncbi:MAG: quinate 5-dehydrogenase [Planctomycetota bacterium]|nr:quinate 5-dehydrogenase [Planctomycetota bacterium]